MVDWMYWIAAVVFTAVGFFMGASSNKHIVTAAVIESLIRQGYLKTKDNGQYQQIIKHDEE